MRTMKSIGTITMLLAAFLLVAAGSAFADRGGRDHRHDGHDRRGRIEHRYDSHKRHADKRHYAKHDYRRSRGHAYGKPYWVGKPHGGRTHRWGGKPRHRTCWAKPYSYGHRPKTQIHLWLR